MTKRIKNKNYLIKLSEMKCCFCRMTPCGEAHHIRKGTNGGMGLKPSDCYAIPICRSCHILIHTKGEVTFYKQYRKTPQEMIEYALSLWKNKDILTYY